MPDPAMTQKQRVVEKYDGLADDWSARHYRDPAFVYERRAGVVLERGPALAPGDTVFEIGCADGGLLELLAARGFAVRGIDISAGMVETARRRLGPVVEAADMLTYVPPEPVAATVLFAVLPYAPDRGAFFAHVASYTRSKIVFDLYPRDVPLETARAELAAAGFDRVDARPWFTRNWGMDPGLARSGAVLLERTGPLARLALRVRGSLMVVAWRS